MRSVHVRSMARRGLALLAFGALIAAALSTISPAQAQTPGSTTATTTIAPVEEEVEEPAPLYSRDSSKDIVALDSSLSTISGVWGSTGRSRLYVADPLSDRIVAFSLAESDAFFGDYVGNDSFSISEKAPRATGIWSDGEWLWIANSSSTDPLTPSARIVVVNLSDGTDIDSEAGFELVHDHWSPGGIWSDGTTLWVLDKEYAKLHAYELSTGTQQIEKQFDLDPAFNADGRGLWSDGTTVWVTDSESQVAVAYTLADGLRDAVNDITLDSENDQPQGLWSDGTTMWVADAPDTASTDWKLFAYRKTGERQGGL